MALIALLKVAVLFLQQQGGGRGAVMGETCGVQIRGMHREDKRGAICVG